MPGKPRFIPDPPDVIAFNSGTAHLLRDPLYGGPTPWASKKQRERWAFFWRNFAAQPPLFSRDELKAKAREFAEKFGTVPYMDEEADEALRYKLKGFLLEEVRRLGLYDKIPRKPGKPPNHKRQRLKRAIAYAVGQIERAEKHGAK